MLGLRHATALVLSAVPPLHVLAALQPQPECGRKRLAAAGGRVQARTPSRVGHSTGGTRHERLEQWRERWADHVNARLAELDIDAQIDHRSFADRGIGLEPQHKIGPSVVSYGCRWPRVRAGRGPPAHCARERRGADPQAGGGAGDDHARTGHLHRPRPGPLRPPPQRRQGPVRPGDERGAGLARACICWAWTDAARRGSPHAPCWP